MKITEKANKLCHCLPTKETKNQKPYMYQRLANIYNGKFWERT